MFSCTYADLCRALLVLGVADGTVLLDDHGPATVAVTHTSSPTVLLGEESLGVGKHELRECVSISTGIHQDNG